MFESLDNGGFYTVDAWNDFLVNGQASIVEEILDTVSQVKPMLGRSLASTIRIVCRYISDEVSEAIINAISFDPEKDVF